MINLKQALLCLISTSCLCGCVANSNIGNTTDDPTMIEIYEGHYEQSLARTSTNRELPQVRDSSDLSSMVTQEANDTFPLLENPMLIMYVFPHVATESRVPIPGYWTAFPMYERFEFALPGEKQDSRGSSN